MKIYAYMNKGKGKTVCEDSCLLGHTVLSEGFISWETHDESLIVSVSDGVGGNSGGAEASFYLSKSLRKVPGQMLSDETTFKEYLMQINKNLIDYAENVEGSEEMAATLSGICLSQGKSLMFHVGNTRVYVVNGEYLMQMTTDHTRVEDMVASGLITRKEAAERPDSNVISACMGNADFRYADRLEVRDVTTTISSEKPLILTSDGIHDYVSIDDMENILCGSEEMQDRLKTIAEKARENGSEDDISVIWIERKE